MWLSTYVVAVKPIALSAPRVCLVKRLPLRYKAPLVVVKRIALSGRMVCTVKGMLLCGLRAFL